MSDLVTPAITRMVGISKSYGGVLANDGVDFDVRPGEIHALLGENGAGKTTLMSVLFGMVQADSGSVWVDAKEVTFHSPRDAIDHGVGMVHQHFKLVPTLTVLENFMLSDTGSVSSRRRKRTAQKIAKLGRESGLDVRPEALVWQLSVGEQQRVEILRALYRGARVLLLDEPTATLAPTEVAALVDRIKGLRDNGVAIVLITHHLEEVMACADRITVLRRGRNVGTVARSTATYESLVAMMMGSGDVADVELARAKAEGEPARHRPPPAHESHLSVRNLAARDDRGHQALADISLEVHAGEIVGIAGVEGNGQTELEEVLVGLRRAVAGHVLLGGHDVTNTSTRRILDRGMALIPSDRYRRGLIASLPLAENLVLDRFHRAPFGSAFRLNRGVILDHAKWLLNKYFIRAPRPTQRAGTLSGGNAQRIVLARALSGDYQVLVCAQPTRGLDVMASEAVRAELVTARENGVGILIISTDLREVMALADRCFVIYKGRLIAEFAQSEMDISQIGRAMGGLAPANTPGPGVSVVTRDRGV